MATQAELEDIADDAASNPHQVSADGVSVVGHSLKEIDDHIDRKLSREAATDGRLGVRFFNTKPPGAT